MKESEFKKYFREKLNMWSNALEPRSGSTMGYPDVLVLVGDRFLPIEMKIGERVGWTIVPREIRPVQIAWHENLWRAGGISMVLVGYQDEYGWQGFALQDARKITLQRYRDGYAFSHCLPIIQNGFLNEELLRGYVQRHLDR